VQWKILLPITIFLTNVSMSMRTTKPSQRSLTVLGHSESKERHVSGNNNLKLRSRLLMNFQNARPRRRLRKRRRPDTWSI